VMRRIQSVEHTGKWNQNANVELQGIFNRAEKPAQ